LPMSAGNIRALGIRDPPSERLLIKVKKAGD
jgi:hypothetical protein